MTCIVGVEDEVGVLIGGDSAGVAGYAITVRSDTKVFERDGYAIGFAGSFRVGQLVHYQLSLPRLDTWDVDAFMVTRFVPALRDCMRAHGQLAVENGVESMEGFLLVGLAGRLYSVECDFQVGRQEEDGYYALGCGDEYAVGALHALADYEDLTPQDRVEAALNAAEYNSAGVVGPFRYAYCPKPVAA